MIASVKKIAMGSLAAVTLGATILATTAPADAQRYRGFRGHPGGFHRGIGPGAGAAIGLGIAGAALATGAAYNYYNNPYNGHPYGAYGYGPYGYPY